MTTAEQQLQQTAAAEAERIRRQHAEAEQRNAAAKAEQLRQQNIAAEREIEQLVRQRQTLAAANDQVAPIPEKYRARVAAAKARLGRAEGLVMLAEQQARTKIRMEGPSEQLARLWFEEMTLGATREQQAAKQELLDAELSLGRRVEIKRKREQAERDAPGRRAAAAARYQAELDAIDRDVMLARTADTD